PSMIFSELGRGEFRLHIAEDVVKAGLAKAVTRNQFDAVASADYVSTPFIAIYGHILWCFEQCSFCHYRRSDVVGRREMQRYVSWLLLHLGLIRRRYELDSKIVRSIYIGGGTPTILPPDLLSSVLAEFCAMNRDRKAEVTVEATIDTLDSSRLAVVAKYSN